MYWKILKNKNQLELGDLVVVQIKKKYEIGFVGKKSIKSIPEKWVQDFEYIDHDGIFRSINKNKIGMIVKYHRMKLPTFK